MSVTKKIIKGDLVKIIAGDNKGTTGKVTQVLSKKSAVLIEGIGMVHRNIKPSRMNPTGGHKDIQLAIPINKIALVVDEKSTKTSRVGLAKNADGKTIRIARQLKNKEIK